MAKFLNVVESAYRATIERQDDTVLRFVHMMAAQAGGDMTLLLRGNAVNYLCRRQSCGKLRFGEAELGNPPRLAEDLEALMKSHVAVYYVEEDAGERGLERSEFISAARAVSRGALAKFVAGYDRVFHW
jgi:hypothetical protein